MTHPQYTQKQIARFGARVGTSIDPGGCRPWTGGADKDGYGLVTIGGVRYRTHRVAWEIANGSIPDGLLVLHKCDNPPCCNTDHHFLGTHVDNMADKVAKGRQAKGEGHGPRNPARGDRNGSRLYPDRLPRGEDHYSRTRPDMVPRGEAVGNALLTEGQVLEIRRLLAEPGVTQRGLARHFGVSLPTINAIHRRRTWRHLP